MSELLKWRSIWSTHKEMNSNRGKWDCLEDFNLLLNQKHLWAHRNHHGRRYLKQSSRKDLLQLQVAAFFEVYKNCRRIRYHLWRLLLKVIWRKGKIPSCWKIAEGCFMPKESKWESISPFQTISLLKVEWKIFFSILAKGLISYGTGNQYIYKSMQKGGVPGFSVSS